jgi:peptidoglycan hydrolase CwlO-like protein
MDTPTEFDTESTEAEDTLRALSEKLGEAADQISDLRVIHESHVDELKAENEEYGSRLDAWDVKIGDVRDYLTERDEFLNRQFADSSDATILAEQTLIRGLLGGLE